MALGTPVAAAAAYNTTAGGTTVTPAYPAGILATDVVLLFVGQKPTTANGGTVTTPTGWTLREELTAAGGYGATLGADTGNTNLRIYSWNTPVAGQTGNLTVTLAGNNISWAFMVRVPTGGSFSFGSADGQRTTAPTVNVAFATALTNGTSDTNFQAGDLAIWAMCIPTDVTTPGQFSAPSVTATGATFGAATELNEPDSGTGNDIGGYSAYASVSSGSSTTAPTVTVTAGGTVTNVRGPIGLLRIRDTAQTLTSDLFTNTNTVYNPTVTPGGVTLTPSLFTNTSTFYTPTVVAAQPVVEVSWLEIEPFPIQTLSPARFDNTNVFYTPTVAAGEVTLTPDLFTNTNTFYTPTVTAGEVTLSPDLFTNTNTFYTPTVSAGEVTLTPALFANTNTFYTPTVTAGEVTLTPALFVNTNTFYTPTVLLQAVVQVSWLEIEATAGQTLLPSLFTNQNTFYAHTLNTQTTITADAGTVQVLGSNAQRELSVAADAGTVNVAGQAADFAITEVLLPALFTNTNTFYTPTVSQGASLVEVSWLEVELVSAAQNLSPPLTVNPNVFYSAALNQQVTLVADSGSVQVLGSNAQRELSVAADGGNVSVTGQAADFSVAKILQPALLANVNTFFAATLSTDTQLTQAARFDNITQFYSPSLLQDQYLTFEDYVTPGYVDPPGYVEYIADYGNVFFVGNLTLQISVSGLQAESFVGTVSQDLSTVVVPTGVQAVCAVGYVNIWGLVDDSQNAGWQLVDDAQAVTWAPVLGSQTPEWQHINVSQNPDWTDEGACIC